MYLDADEFKAEIIKAQQCGTVGDTLGRMFLLLAENVSLKAQPTDDREEIISRSVYDLVRSVSRFDTSRNAKDIFNYATTACFRSAINHRRARWKYAELTPMVVATHGYEYVSLELPLDDRPKPEPEPALIEIPEPEPPKEKRPKWQRPRKGTRPTTHTNWRPPGFMNARMAADYIGMPLTTFQYWLHKERIPRATHRGPGRIHYWTDEEIKSLRDHLRDAYPDYFLDRLIPAEAISV